MIYDFQLLVTQVNVSHLYLACIVYEIYVHFITVLLMHSLSYTQYIPKVLIHINVYVLHYLIMTVQVLSYNKVIDREHLYLYPDS